MNAVQLGPLVFSMAVIIVILSVIAAILAGRMATDTQKRQITDGVIAGAICALIGARLLFVWHYWPDYAHAPLSALDIRDGGFDIIGAIFGLIAYILWAIRHRPKMHGALGAAVTAGVISWVALNGVALLLNHSTPARPDTQLADISGKPVTLAALAAAHPGQPMVVNLWATWCPPCRKELPMLAAAQKAKPGVIFVFVDEGEPAKTVKHFLQNQGLSPHNVLLDGGKKFSQAMNARAYPTTFFFAPDGKLVTQHVGMLSKATLARSLNQLKAAIQSGKPTQPAAADTAVNPAASS